MVEMKEIQIKVIVAGEPGSGKSILSEVNDACISLKKLGVSIGLKTILDEDAEYSMTFITWTLTKGRPKDTTYTHGTKAAVVVCDLSKGKTVKKMKKWTKSIKKGIGEIPIIYVGNNVDGAKAERVDRMLNYAKAYDAPVVLTRLSDRTSIEEVFVQIVKAIGSGMPNNAAI
jgi:signal recognition particle receptor subunit beta